jgi:hypothetical protein
MTDSKEQQPATTRVSGLHQLRGGFRPARDLWPEIERRIAGARSSSEWIAPIRAGWRHWPPVWARVAAAAVLLVTLGVWIGHRERTPSLARRASEGAPSLPIMASACVSDAQYLRERAALLSASAESLAGLPPESRQRVLVSLSTIHNAVRDIETALARDSTNPLLQELLLTTCQDETRVLTEVQAAGNAQHAGRGI